MRGARGARFDPATGRRVIQLVYDGERGAGKSTNITHLSRAFEHVRVYERPSRAVGGATLDFDWLQLRGGTRDELPVDVTIIGTPGLRGLASRRAAIVEEADVIVVVCDATPVGVQRAVRASRSRPKVPIVLQANHQARAGALAPSEVARALSLSDVPAVAADARDGRGVVPTLLAALGAAHDELGARDALGRAVPVGPPLTAAALSRSLASVEVDRERCAEHLLRLAATARAAR